ncbi:MAG: hypothetical protein EOL98_09025 [Negativicutes bacterium]|nr:hypothetical protein [Negativicutes bacterium]
MGDIVNFIKYPNLSLLLWNYQDKILGAGEAFSVLDSRLGKYLNENSLNADEMALVESLADEYGGGICGPVVIGGCDRGLLVSEIIEIIKCHIDTDFICNNGFFLGGTALSALRHGETRPFMDIEFVCTGWIPLSAVKLRAAELADLLHLRGIRVDINSVTIWVNFCGRPCKIVFLNETLLGLSPPVDCFGLSSLNDIDLLALKLVSCSHSHFFRCDKAGELADVLKIFIDDPSVLRPAWIKVVSAYGMFIYERILDILNSSNLNVLFKECCISEEKAAELVKAIPYFREGLLCSFSVCERNGGSISTAVNNERFAKFVHDNVYWWGGYRPDPDVDAALRFILAKQPRYVEDMAREQFGFTDEDFIRALKDTRPGLFWGVGIEQKWENINKRLGIDPPLPFPKNSIKDWEL